MTDSQFILFSGTAGRQLAAHTAQLLDRPMGRCTIERFPDGEVNVHLDEPVRGRDVFLLQISSRRTRPSIPAIPAARGWTRSSTRKKP